MTIGHGLQPSMGHSQWLQTDYRNYRNYNPTNTLSDSQEFRSVKPLHTEYYINRQDRYNRTALHYAVSYGDLEDVAGLVKSGADIDQVDDGWQSPVFLSVLHNKKKTMTYLMQQGV